MLHRDSYSYIDKVASFSEWNLSRKPILKSEIADTVSKSDAIYPHGIPVFSLYTGWGVFEMCQDGFSSAYNETKSVDSPPLKARLWYKYMSFGIISMGIMISISICSDGDNDFALF